MFTIISATTGVGYQKKDLVKTIYCDPADYDKRPHDDEEEVSTWPSTMEYLPVPSYLMFKSFWAREYPKLKIRGKVNEESR